MTYDVPKNGRTFLKCCWQTVVGERVLLTSSVGPPVVDGIGDHHGGAPPLFELFVVCAPIGAHTTTDTFYTWFLPNVVRDCFCDSLKHESSKMPLTYVVECAPSFVPHLRAQNLATLIFILNSTLLHSWIKISGCV